MKKYIILNDLEWFEENAYIEKDNEFSYGINRYYKNKQHYLGNHPTLVYLDKDEITEYSGKPLENSFCEQRLLGDINSLKWAGLVIEESEMEDYPEYFI